MKARLYTYDIKKIDYGKKIRKQYTFTFIIEFEYNNVNEYIQKFRIYAKGNKPIYVSEQEQDGQFYVMLRKKNYKLEKGVNVI